MRSFQQHSFWSCVAVVLCGIADPSLAKHQILINELSFGYDHNRIKSEGSNPVAGFQVVGTPDVPEVLANKIALTGGTVAYQRGAIWAEKVLQPESWTADIDFLVTGPERGGGNFNVWLAADGPTRVGTSSIMKVGKWEGLAIVIDQYGGTAGNVRGFLNDGSIDYQAHHAVDSLAFGRCAFPYRNRADSTQLKIRHSQAEGLRVDIGGHLCFATDKVRIPPGVYHLGITSAGAEQPDRHEVFKMIVMTDSDEIPGSPSSASNRQPQQEQQQQQQQIVPPPSVVNDDDVPDSKADTITNTKAQFADLHNRLQSLNHRLSAVFRQISMSDRLLDKHVAELSAHSDAQTTRVLNRLDESLTDMRRRLDALERDVSTALKNDVAAQLRRAEASSREGVNAANDKLLRRVADDAAAGYHRLLLAMIGGQIALAALYVLHQRSVAGDYSKKYL